MRTLLCLLLLPSTLGAIALVERPPIPPGFDEMPDLKGGTQFIIRNTPTWWGFARSTGIWELTLGDKIVAPIPEAPLRGPVTFLNARLKFVTRRYQRIRYPEIQKSVDLVYDVSSGFLVIRWEAKPGADLSKISFTSINTVVPSAWQEVAGKRVNLNVAEFPTNYNRDGVFSYSFRPEPIDPKLPVILEVRAKEITVPPSDFVINSAATANGAYLFSGHLLYNGRNCSGLCSTAYAGRVSPTGDLDFMTYFLTEENGTTAGIKLDSSGNIFFLGNTQSPNFPVTPGALQPVHGGRVDCFAASLNGNTGELLWATFYGGPGNQVVADIATGPADRIWAAVVIEPDSGELLAFEKSGALHARLTLPAKPFRLTVDSAGSAYVLFANRIGRFIPTSVVPTSYLDFPLDAAPSMISAAVPGSVWLAYESGPVKRIEWPGGRVLAESPVRAGRPLWLGADPSGNANIARVTTLDPVPLTPDALLTRRCEPNVYFERLSPTGEHLNATYLDRFHPIISLDPSGNLNIGDALRLVWNRSQFAYLGCSFPFIISPGALVSLDGTGLGPAVDLAALPDPDTNLLPKSLAGVTAFFNDTPVSIVSTANHRLQVLAPFSMPVGEPVTVRLLRDGLPAAERKYGTYPALFAPLAIVNEDGSANSRERPAPSGSIITMYATGLGQFTPAALDGQIMNDARPLAPPLLFTARINLSPAEVELLYVGSAPGQPSGVQQINLRLPAIPQGAYFAVQPSIGRYLQAEIPIWIE